MSRSMPKPQESKAPVESEVELKEPEAPQELAVFKPKSPAGIEVVALQKGFYNQFRLKAGDKFLIPSMDKFGRWMKLADPKAEEARLKALKVVKQQSAGK